MKTQSYLDSETSLKEHIKNFVTDFTTETTPFSAIKIDNFENLLGEGRTVYVTFLPGSNYNDTVETAKRLKQEGLVPVPHIAARSVPSKCFLENALKRLTEEVGINEVLIVGGAVDHPVGCYSDSMQILETGLFDKYEITKIGVAGHPEGSPDITDQAISKALIWKNKFSERTNSKLYIVTQFCFEAEPIIKWDRLIQAEGNKLPIRIGVPGIASLKTLIGYAKSCGVGPSIRFLTRQTKNFTKLVAQSAPDKQIIALARYWASDPACGLTGIHMYPLGGVKKSSEWINNVVRGNFKINGQADGFAVNIDH